MKYLVFYDGKCGMCDAIVRILLRLDKKELFAFAPLEGTTAEQYLQQLPEKYRGEDSLILIENFQEETKQFYLLGNAALRICWLLGGMWKTLGWMFFLPSYPFDVLYRFIARNRYRVFGKAACHIPRQVDKNRFFP